MVEADGKNSQLVMTNIEGKFLLGNYTSPHPSFRFSRVSLLNDLVVAEVLTDNWFAGAIQLEKGLECVIYNQSGG